jgi:hypothetical protein
LVRIAALRPSGCNSDPHEGKWFPMTEKDDRAERQMRQDLGDRLAALRDAQVPRRLLELCRELQDLVRGSDRQD